MFTGLITHVEKLIGKSHVSSHTQLKLSNPFKDLTLGESISLNGACLTVTEFSEDFFYVEVFPETIKKVAPYEMDSFINLERSMKMGDRLGGHFVLGHVDEAVEVFEVKSNFDFKEITVGPVGAEFKKYLISKGSIALNGVSLTINDVIENFFKVGIISHTLSHTNLKNLEKGNRVNLEYDYLIKAVKQNAS